MSGNMFVVKLKKKDGSVEKVFYFKDKEKLDDDFHIVRAYSKDKRYRNVVWSGVINRDYETVIGFKPWKRIEMLNSNQLLAQEELMDKLYTYHMDLSKKSMLCVFGKFERLSDDLLKVEMLGDNKFEGDREKYALYSLSKGSVISKGFHEIVDSCDMDKKKLYLVKYCLRGNVKYLPEIYYYLDCDGSICSPVYYTLSNEYMKILDSDLNSWIDREEMRLLEYFKNEEIGANLKKKIVLK